MTVDELLSALGYSGSPQFLRRGDGRFESEPGYGHIFRRGEDKADDQNRKRWRVEGVYGLRDSEAHPERFVPIVYVCKADDEQASHNLHRLVWNQDVVPYVLVHDPKGVRVYAGYHYSAKGKTDAARGILQALTDWDRVQSIVNLFNANAIDGGKIWQNAHLQVDPSRRVYHQLLKDLRELDKWLRGAGRLKKDISHALIGKYVYLHYLRDRNILSSERLTGMWGIHESEIFKSTATKVALEKLTEKLDDWLNGDIFPLSFSGPNAPTSDHIKRVAATFAGDKISGENWQPHFDFKAYDFSYIPIETLSLIYEQFLHAEEDDANKAKKKKTKGRAAGAYYTPLPLVNFMLAELQGRHPLKEGMKICDPSCGSGAFLVQAYRRLIETTYPIGANALRPKPTDLRRLLQTSIFGVDVDGDACQVTQLSLILTLLDYVDPPDLTGRNSSFTLPSLLHPKPPERPNLFESNLFEVEPRLRAAAGTEGFDWVVGNPPWKQLKKKKHDGHDQPVWDWMQTNTTDSPVGMYQVAQAFAWEAPRYLAKNGECALLVPAMGLFEEPSAQFRKTFFRHFQVHTMANFANLAEVLFDGRSRVPAAALFYRRRVDGAIPEPDEAIMTYSPLVVNQEATRPLQSGERRKLWSLVVNGSEVRTVEFEEVANGSGLPWKLAMWGTHWDERLVKRLERKWSTIRNLETKGTIIVAQGPELRKYPTRVTSDEDDEDLDQSEITDEEAAEQKFERMDDLVGKPQLNVNALKRLRDIFSIPKDALIPNQRRWVCLIHGKSGLEICEPPHVLVSAARNFAVYSDRYVLVPARQVGIISSSQDKLFLKALALYLSSDFAFYHQFLRSTHFGVQRGVATLEALRYLPVPLASLSHGDLQNWADLHNQLAKFPPRTMAVETEDKEQGKLAFAEEAQSKMQPLLQKLNELTAQALGLDSREGALVHDFVRVRFQLNDGKLGIAAIRPPESKELRVYARRVKEELDNFVGDDSDRLHRVTVVYEDAFAMVEVDFTRDREAARKIEVFRASSDEARRLRAKRQELLDERAQWVYFNRNLRLYRGHQTYIFKPLQRFHWTESAAMMDASELIAETLGESATV